MKFLKNKINNWLNSDNDCKLRPIGSVNEIEGSSIRDESRSIQFRVYSASGGKVVETMRYDKVKDRHITGLHIITEDQDLGKQLEKIITMEYLR
jgi:hypothetical protein